MAKFFDRTTKTLYITGGKTSETDLSENPLVELNKSKREGLRRENAIIGNQLIKSFVSSSGYLLQGNFDMNDRSNADLEEVQNTIFCP